jgi:hypothetical protein
MRRGTYERAEFDRKCLEKVLAELRQGKLGQLSQAEADHVITALERRIEGLSAEMRSLAEADPIQRALARGQPSGSAPKPHS